MSPGTETGQDLIRQVVRGERPWTDLRTVGINIQMNGTHCAIDNPGRLTAAADVQDLARGLLAHLQDPRALRTWAFVLEAESFVDWGDAERHPAWEPLWDAVWRASFGDPVPEEAIQMAAELLQRKLSNP
jgi:hypothetical protein